MADLATPTAGAVIALSAATTLTASQAASIFLGVPLNLLVWGAIGGLVALVNVEPREPPLTGVPLALYAVSRLFSASAVGGIFSGLVVPLSVRYVPFLADLGQLPITPAAGALVVGMLTAFLPDIFKFGKAWVARRMNP